MCEKNEGAYSVLENAKNYLNISMDLARTLKEDGTSSNSSSLSKSWLMLIIIWAC